MLRLAEKLGRNAVLVAKHPRRLATLPGVAAISRGVACDRDRIEAADAARDGCSHQPRHSAGSAGPDRAVPPTVARQALAVGALPLLLESCDTAPKLAMLGAPARPFPTEKSP